MLIRQGSLILKIEVSVRSREKKWEKEEGVTEEAKPTTPGIQVESMRRARHNSDWEIEDYMDENEEQDSRSSAKGRTVSKTTNLK